MALAGLSTVGDGGGDLFLGVAPGVGGSVISLTAVAVSAELVVSISTAPGATAASSEIWSCL